MDMGSCSLPEEYVHPNLMAQINIILRQGIWSMSPLKNPDKHVILQHLRSLTLVMVNKLRCHAHFQISANQIS